jgi:hypothetical protein
MSTAPPTATPTALPADLPRPDFWPTHLDLPCDDGAIVTNFQEHPQAVLLSDALAPVLRGRHPEQDYCVGQDCGIYWRRLPEPRAVAPDWFYVPDVAQRTDGPRRSFVLWDEPGAPLVVLEFASADGAEERDRTPGAGKFWVYQHVIRPPFYGILLRDPWRMECYRHRDGRFVRAKPTVAGRHPVPQLGVELGLWEGEYLGVRATWMRWYAPDGTLLPTGHELAEQERQLKEKYAAKLRELGVDPDQL